MKGRIAVWLGMSVLMVTNLLSQQTARQWITFPFHEEVTALAEAGGSLWVGTSSGLIKVDKASLSTQVFDKGNSQLTDDNVNTVTVDGNGVVWAGTNQSLVRIKDGEWIVYTSQNSALPRSAITKIFIDNDGNKWIGTESSGLVLLDAQHQWKVFDRRKFNLPSGRINDILIDKNKQLWVAASGGIAFAEPLMPFKELDAYKKYMINAEPCALASADEAMWIGFGERYYNSSGGIYVLYPDSHRVFTKSNSIMPSGDVQSLCYSGGTMYAGTAQNNFSSLISIIKNEVTLSVINDVSVSAILKDRDNVIWAGTKEGGLIRIKNGEAARVNLTGKTTPENAAALTSVKKGIVIHTHQGVKYHWSAESESIRGISDSAYSSLMKNYSVETGVRVSSHTVFSVLRKPNEMWIATDTGLVVENTRGRNKIYLPGNNVVNALCGDEEKYVFIGTQDAGLIQLSNDTAISFSTANSSLPSNNVTSLVCDKNNVKWIGTAKGLARFDGISWNIYDTSNSGLSDLYITALSTDLNNTLWVGTVNGLSSYDGISWKKYSSAQSGLADNYISAIATDAQNNKWILIPSKGLSVFNESGLELKAKSEKSGITAPLVEVSPNPSEGKFQVTLAEDRAPGNGKVTVYDVLGNRVYQAAFGNRNNFYVDISANPKGIYFVEVNTGKERINRKIIVN